MLLLPAAGKGVIAVAYISNDRTGLLYLFATRYVHRYMMPLQNVEAPVAIFKKQVLT
jgi:hypothetical protein